MFAKDSSFLSSKKNVLWDGGLEMTNWVQLHDNKVGKTPK